MSRQLLKIKRFLPRRFLSVRVDLSVNTSIIIMYNHHKCPKIIIVHVLRATFIFQYMNRGENVINRVKEIANYVNGVCIICL